MQQFFAEPSWITESEILIRGADLNHMKNVLRMKVGEDVRINDGQGTTYLCCLNRYEKDQAVLDVFRKLDTETELPSEIILFQGLPKGDKMECHFICKRYKQEKCRARTQKADPVF